MEDKYGYNSLFIDSIDNSYLTNIEYENPKSLFHASYVRTHSNKDGYYNSNKIFYKDELLDYCTNSIVNLERFLRYVNNGRS
jgi:hypothetical protein